VLWRLRYKLSLRDLTEMFLRRGFTFSDEVVGDWEARLTPTLAEYFATIQPIPQANINWTISMPHASIITRSFSRGMCAKTRRLLRPS
jgi:hypothetical protein